jgi:hypothetical protein
MGGTPGNLRAHGLISELILWRPPEAIYLTCNHRYRSCYGKQQGRSG